MRLSAFLNDNRAAILTEWAEFASSCTPAANIMDYTDLRDHANEILTVIAADLDTSQTPRQQEDKSQGRADSVGTTAAHAHGSDRAESGFTMDQMVAEYRALRASVVRLWTAEMGGLGQPEVDDLIRFNEAIDQSLAESVARYSKDLEYSREMFLGILGHDLRTPLGAIITSATFMIELDELKEPNRTLMSRIASSSQRMDRMVGDLLDLTRSRLGSGIPIQPSDMDLHVSVLEVVGELQALHTEAIIEVRESGNLQGRWDSERIAQALANLIGNAVEHGDPRQPVGVELTASETEVKVAVHNHGPPIPPSLVRRIFEPMKRRQTGSGAHLGLGLYIAERVVAAHGGDITVRSEPGAGTTFTVRLPRSA